MLLLPGSEDTQVAAGGEQADGTEEASAEGEAARNQLP